LYEETNHAFERSVAFMHKMPRIWLDYCQFLMDQGFVTRTRGTFNRALRALPITQHHRVWKLYLSFAKSRHIPAEIAVRVYRRFMKLQPEYSEEFINYLIENKRLDEAARRLEEIINQSDFVSKFGKSKHQLWNELCDLMSKNPDKVQSLRVDLIIRQGIRRYTDQVGPLWNSLAEYYIRSRNFEKFL
jgi:pre-mRNA-splicing factor SYF1